MSVVFASSFAAPGFADWDLHINAHQVAFAGCAGGTAYTCSPGGEISDCDGALLTQQVFPFNTGSLGWAIRVQMAMRWPVNTYSFPPAITIGTAPGAVTLSPTLVVALAFDGSLTLNFGPAGCAFTSAPNVYSRDGSMHAYQVLHRTTSLNPPTSSAALYLDNVLVLSGSCSNYGFPFTGGPRILSLRNFKCLGDEAIPLGGMLSYGYVEVDDTPTVIDFPPCAAPTVLDTWCVTPPVAGPVVTELSVLQCQPAHLLVVGVDFQAGDTVTLEGPLGAVPFTILSQSATEIVLDVPTFVSGGLYCVTVGRP